MLPKKKKKTDLYLLIPWNAISEGKVFRMKKKKRNRFIIFPKNICLRFVEVIYFYDDKKNTIDALFNYSPDAAESTILEI